jgi:hypothetical protein
MAAQEGAHLLGERGFLGGESEMHGDERKHLRSLLVKHRRAPMAARAASGGGQDNPNEPGSTEVKRWSSPGQFRLASLTPGAIIA